MQPLANSTYIADAKCFIHKTLRTQSVVFATCIHIADAITSYVISLRTQCMILCGRNSILYYFFADAELHRFSTFWTFLLLFNVCDPVGLINVGNSNLITINHERLLAKHHDYPIWANIYLIKPNLCTTSFCYTMSVLTIKHV